jgi:hypothetical protein
LGYFEGLPVDLGEEQKPEAFALLEKVILQ